MIICVAADLKLSSESHIISYTCSLLILFDLSVWRVTRGPNRDWPLGLCDYTTLDLGDVEFSDVIHKNKVGESTRLYYSDRQRWYYLDDQTTSEIAVFRNVDSRGLEIPCKSLHPNTVLLADTQ
jgi:hypothetical protein